MVRDGFSEQLLNCTIMQLIVWLFGCILRLLRLHNSCLDYFRSVNPRDLSKFKISKFVKMFVPLGQQTALPLCLCKSSWNVKEFARFYPTQWISGYYHFSLNGVCGSTYIQGRGLRILFKKLWIFQPREISFKPRVTPSADSNSRYRYIIATRFSFQIH